MRTYKDYRGNNVKREDCKIFLCECDNKKFEVVAFNGDMAINILRKYHKGNRYTARWTKRYYISMLENESDAILNEL